MMQFSSALHLLCFLTMTGMALALDADLLFSLSLRRYISIDCGLKENSSYEDYSEVIYTPDNGYVDSGISVNVPDLPEFDSGTPTDLPERYWRLRFFPNGTRNCYTVWPVTEGERYLLRAGFFYGNYNSKNSPPKFDLYVGVNLWERIDTLENDSVTTEIVVRAPEKYLDVCLVKTGSGTPFISVLEVRPVQGSLYSMVDSSHSLILREKRVNYGGKWSTRFMDSYDRMWFPSGDQIGWTSVSTEKYIKRDDSGTWTVSPEVLRTAIISEGLSFTITVHSGERSYLFLYFAELEELGSNETREFNVLEDGELSYGSYRPKYLNAEALYTSNSGQKTTYTYSLNSTSNSTRPPMLNALEIYGLRKLKFAPTDPHDMAVMRKIKDRYGVKRNWQGDPCLPRDLSWEGVGCRYDDLLAPRIISLNLSMSGLEGEISPSFVNLTALTFLDLSNNNLKGKIPDKLMNLRNLEVINLSNNKLSGSLPDVFYSRSKTGALLLSIWGNTELCKNVDFCQAPKKENKEIEISVSAIAVIVMAVILLFSFITRKQKSIHRATKNGKSKKHRSPTVQPTGVIPLAEP